MLPTDWSRMTLFVLAGEQKSRFDDGDWVEAEFITASGIRLLQTGNIGVGEFVEKEEKKYIDEKAFKQLRCKDVYPGDILICRLADPAGRACIAPQLSDSRMITSVDVTIFRPLPDRADATFLVNVLSTSEWFAEVSERCGGSTRTRISRGQLAQVRVQVPPIKEQRAIATALSDADALIESLDRLIAKKRAIKKAAMQQLLTGETRLPGFEGAWDTARLGECVSIRNSKVMPSRVSPQTHGIELEHIGQADGQLLTHVTAADLTASKYQFVKGDVLFGRLRSYLRKFWWADRDGVCTTEIWPLAADGRMMLANYLYLMVQTEEFMEASSISYGTHMPRADWKVMRNLEIRLPGLEEQQAIANVVLDMERELTLLHRRRDKAKQIKQGMMQELLTGRTRLVERDQEAVEEAPA